MLCVDGRRISVRLKLIECFLLVFKDLHNKSFKSTCQTAAEIIFPLTFLNNKTSLDSCELIKK